MKLNHGVSVPDLRSDGESSSNDRTPPSISSSTYSSNKSSNIWKGSLPNLTVQLSTRTQDKQSQHPYATFADNLNQVETKESVVPNMTNDDTPVRSVGYKSQSPAYAKVLSVSMPSLFLSCTSQYTMIFNPLFIIASSSFFNEYRFIMFSCYF